MKTEIVNKLKEIDEEKVREEILEGLTSVPRSISPKYFYDADGSDMFEHITELEEYYPTRTEKAILAGLLDRLDLDFQGLNIVELGSGDPSKISLLFEQIPEETLRSMHYYPVDISPSALENSTGRLGEEFPELQVTGIAADFMQQLDKLPRTGHRLICFFGSTIGNLDPWEMETFMGKLGREMQAGDHLLLGLDMVKDPRVLHRAYNDSRQLTAAFNKNILQVINGIIDASFDPGNFEHLAFYNEKEERIEMHLKATRDQQVRINGSQKTLSIKKGDTIHTENSYKFNRETIESLGRMAGLNTAAVFNDEKNWFSLVLYGK